jgi:hypothetical protein
LPSSSPDEAFEEGSESDDRWERYIFWKHDYVCGMFVVPCLLLAE